MADRSRPDQNNQYSLIAVSNGDGVTPVTLWADPSTHSLVTSSGAGGGAATIADGADVAEGATADAANTTGTTGTISGKLRGLVLNQTNGNQLTRITNGTNTADTLAADTGFNSQVIAGSIKTFNFTTSLAGAQTILANTDVRGYAWIEISYSSIGVGLALTGQYAQVSGGTFNSLAVFGTAAATTTSALGVANNTLYQGPIRGNYFQIAVSALTSGTFTGTVTLKTLAPPMAVLSVNLAAGSNLAGKVGIDQTTVGTTNAVSLAQIGAATILTGNGVTGTGSPRVTIASDQTPFNVLAGTTSAVVNVGQATVATTATQISVTSTVPTNGILIGALSTNAASIFVGGSGVTTATGAELTPGSSLPFTANLNTLYIISVASTTDKIWYSVT